MHFLLFSNVNKDPGQVVTGRLAALLADRGVSSTIEAESDEDTGRVIEPEFMAKVDAVIVLGGDGTMLRASHAIGESPVPMIGLNLGTTGFLTEVECGAMEEMADRLISGDYTVQERMQLRGVLRRGGDGKAEDSTESFTALNDIVIIREGVLRLIAIRIYVNDVFFDTYEADGVILSTPTGSTGYNLSAGGPIVSPEARLLVMTPVSPHSLTKKSIVFRAEDRIRVELLEKRKTQKNEAVVSFDGYKNYEISVGDEVEICADAHPLHMISLEERSFYEVLSRKL